MGPVACGLFAAALCGGCGRLDFRAIDASPDVTSVEDAFVPVTPRAAYSLNSSTQSVSPSVGTASGLLGSTAGVDTDDPLPVVGHFGMGLAFDAIDDTITVGYSAALFDIGVDTVPISYGVWVRANPSSQYRVILEIGGETNGAILGITDAGRVRFLLRSGTNAQLSKVLDSERVLPTSMWCYLVATADSSGMTLRYYDETGTKLEELGASGAYVWNTGLDGIAIGSNPNDNSGLRGMLTTGPEAFDGIIDEVRIYDVGISEAQIAYDRVTPL